MALTNKTVAGSYKDLLQIDNSNSGLTSSGKTIKDGDGNSSCVSLGADKISITPSTNSTSNATMSNASGDVLLKMDGTNKLIKVNENWNTLQCLREMRRQAEHIKQVHTIYVVDNNNILLGSTYCNGYILHLLLILFFYSLHSFISFHLLYLFQEFYR